MSGVSGGKSQPGIARSKSDGLRLGRRTGKPGQVFSSVVIVTINPLAPASIFWNNRFLRSELAVNRLDRKLT
jgi:hypothetical protein